MLDAIIIRKIRSNLQLIKRERDFKEFDKIQTVLIVFELSNLEKAKVLEATLIQDGKNCALFAFQKSNNEILTDNGIFTFSLKQLNFWGIPNQLVINEFLKQSNNIDLLIDISDYNCLPLSYLVSLSKPKLKIGILKEGFHLYDFMIDVEKNIDGKFLSQQIMFYLRKLKSQH